MFHANPQWACVLIAFVVADITDSLELDKTSPSPTTLASNTSISTPAEGSIDRDINTLASVPIISEILTTEETTTEHVNSEVNCEKFVCVRKCCGQGRIAVAHAGCENVSSYNTTEWMPSFASAVSSSKLKLLHGTKPWRKFSDDIACIPITTYELNEDGYIFYTDTATFYSHEYYCMDNEFDPKTQATKEVAMICYDHVYDKYIRNITENIHLFAQITSVVFIFLTLVLYMMSPAKVDFQNKCTISCCVGLFYGLALASINFSSAVQTIGLYPNVCIALGVVQQFFLLSFYFWLNIMCFDIARIMRGTFKFVSFQDLMKPWYRFYCYCIYAWGIPFTVSFVTTIIQYNVKEDTNIITPQIGDTTCWLKIGMSRIVYFYAVIIVTHIANSMFLIYAFCLIYQESGMQLFCRRNKTPQLRVHSSTNYLDLFKQRLGIFVLYNFIWIMDNFTLIYPRMIFWDISNVIVSLQGVFFFFFTIKCNNYLLLKNAKKRVSTVVKSCFLSNGGENQSHSSESLPDVGNSNEDTEVTNF